ncbi:MAG TPA: SigE family RNA polymerase sigma factor [Actinomycetota bacterium]|jgi:RNA polymerase sigma-70 factor (ECF subfamily)
MRVESMVDTGDGPWSARGPSRAAGAGEFSGFCSSHYNRLVGVLGLYCGDRATGEELAQEALARAWSHWAKVRDLEDPAGWLYRVAMNLANSHFRRKRAERRAHQSGRPIPDGGEDPAAILAIRAAVAQLPRRKRTVLVLRYYLDLPFAQVAQLMDAPESTVKSLARRALEDLRGEFTPTGEANYVY